MSAPQQIAPTRVPFPLDGQRGDGSGKATAPASGSAHTDKDLQAAIDRVVRHGCRDAVQMAGGNNSRARALMRRQGEVLMLAGLRLVGEAER